MAAKFSLSFSILHARHTCSPEKYDARGFARARPQIATVYRQESNMESATGVDAPGADAHAALQHTLCSTPSAAHPLQHTLFGRLEYLAIWKVPRRPCPLTCRDSDAETPFEGASARRPASVSGSFNACVWLPVGCSRPATPARWAHQALSDPRERIGVFLCIGRCTAPAPSSS
jgi:hypothetical protein